MAKNNFSMIPDHFRAFYVDSNHESSIKKLPYSILPPHEVTIKVEYSSLNYKDALSARGLHRVTKSYPHIPGIDAVGTILEDSTRTYKQGDCVVVTGHDLGTNTFGGFGELIRVPIEWVVKKPDVLTPLQTMIMGTAGFTALYGIHRLQVEGITPEKGPILVTGATGGVGSFAVFALSKLGFEVIAATRKNEEHDFLIRLGAHKVLSSVDDLTTSKRLLNPRKWMGCIETVGGTVLDAVLTQISPKGSVACCGNVLGVSLNTNILPFILRGISLLGIDSAYCNRNIREKIWEQAGELDLSTLPNDYYEVIPLKELHLEIENILKGKLIGRNIVNL